MSDFPTLMCKGCGRELPTPDDVQLIHGEGPFCLSCVESAEGLTFAEWLDQAWQRQRPH